ncbi:MAG TPA: hypothetical protein VH478_07505 [Trebonia sp.]|jgi:hypothetical protein|nr:hypothetical protein [Trebonia sp.]
MGDVWRLPGPARLADAARAQLDRGTSVVLGLPAPLAGDADFHRGLRRAIDVHFDLLDTSAAEDRPVASVVAEQMSIDDVPPGADAVSMLARHSKMLGRRLAFPLAGKAEDIASWVAFMRSFLAAARPIPTPDRPLLLITGGHPCALAFTGADLATLWWWGVLDRIDTSCHVQDLLPGRARNGLLRDTIAEVAGYDLDLASHLAADWDGDEATLASALAGYTAPDWAHARVPGSLPRTSTPLSAPPAALVTLWDLGLADGWDMFGVYVHACANAPDRNRLRIWRAQIRNLMPLIDEERARIETWLHREVRGLQDGRVLEAGDLFEIVQGDYRLKSWRGGHRKRLVSWLRDARNTLAHLETLSPDEVARGRRLIWEDRQAG